MEDGLDKHLKFNVGSAEFKRIAKHVMSLRPVHRCNATVFKSILSTKRLFSLSKLSGADDQEPLAVAILEEKFIKWQLSSQSKTAARQYIEDFLKKGKEASSWDWAWYAVMIGSDKLKRIDDIFRTYEQWQAALKGQLPGVGFGGDKLMGLDDTVFSILGPHNTENYGQIQLIFAPEVLQHPNSYVLPCAGTYFNSNGGRKFQGVGANPGPMIHRAWATAITKRSHEMRNLSTQQKQENFMRNMLHCSVPDWWRVVAKELIARAAQWMGVDVSSVTWENILAFNAECEGHAWLEARQAKT